MKRKRAAVFSAAANFAAGADDPRDTGFQIVGDVTVVLLEIGAGHQDLDVLVEHLLGGIPEQPFGAGVEHLDESPGINDDDAVDGRVEYRLKNGFHVA